MAEVKESGLDIAIRVTLQIASLLPNKQNKRVYTKAVQSIFGDQLKIYTAMNRKARHQLRGRINTILREKLK